MNDHKGEIGVFSIRCCYRLLPAYLFYFAFITNMNARRNLSTQVIEMLRASLVQSHFTVFLFHFSGLVSEIKQHFAAEEASTSTTKSDREEVLITDDDTSLQKFCLVLEKILRHGIKGED